MDENINKFGYGRNSEIYQLQEPVNLAQRIMGQDLNMF
jgi:hypothetical protein